MKSNAERSGKRFIRQNIKEENFACKRDETQKHRELELIEPQKGAFQIFG